MSLLLLEQLLRRNVKRFRGRLVFKAHRLFVLLNSRLESDKGEKEMSFRGAFCRSKARVAMDDLIFQKVFIKSFCRGQFSHKSVNLFFVIVIMKNKLTDLRGN